ncbi:MAG: RnfH family protein [Xanthomonadales bacterium]|nr:RnfH family protein [Xanthomonadales bacterium]
MTKADQQLIQVEVVLAMADRQELVELEVAVGTTIAEAISQSGVPGMFECFELNLENVGVFGRKASSEQILQAGDRVEIYRPLIADPKEVRRQRALKQAKT